MDKSRDIADLLSQCRVAMSSGSGSIGDALGALVQAISLSRGEDKVIETLQQARRDFLADADRERSAHYRTELASAIAAMNNMLDKPSILGDDHDRGDILVDAFEDGSSIICAKCGALVPKDRALQHASFWCEAADHMELSDCD